MDYWHGGQRWWLPGVDQGQDMAMIVVVVFAADIVIMPAVLSVAAPQGWDDNGPTRSWDGGLLERDS